METEREILFQFADIQQILILISRLALDIIIVSAIVIPKFILKQKKEFAFSLYLFNFVIFALCYVILHTKFGWTAGIGLFAIFAMLRFRSEMLNLMDMTYLLAIISIGFVNAAFNGSISFMEIVLLNLGLFMMIHTLSHLLASTTLSCKKIKYNNLELIKPNRKEELIEDLRMKTGFKIEKVHIDTINLEDQNAIIHIFYDESDISANPIRKNNQPAERYFSIFKTNHV